MNDLFGILGADNLLALITTIMIWFAMKYTCELYHENPWLSKPANEDTEYTEEELADPLLKRRDSDEWLVAAIWAAITVLAFLAVREFSMARDNSVWTQVELIGLLGIWGLTGFFTYDVYR